MAAVHQVTTGAELSTAITSVANGDTIELTNDIDAVTSSTRSLNRTFTIEGNGYTIDGKNVNNTSLRFSGERETVTIRNVTFRNMVNNLSNGDYGGGGAICTRRGIYIIENCAFIGNRAASVSSSETDTGGGAIFLEESSGSITVKNSTFYNNSSNGPGGAIVSRQGPITIINCTIVGNTAGNANYAGGVLGNGTNVKISNSIIVGNGTYDVRTISDQGYNLFGTLYSNVTKHDTSTAGLTVSTAGLDDSGPQDNGTESGSPYTIALLPGSPAIDAGSAQGLTTDQRGYPRNDGQPDIGAYEDDGYLVKAPKAQPGAGTYFTPQTVRLTSVTAGAGFYYTLDGSDPITNGTLYDDEDGIYLDGFATGAETLKAAANLGDDWSRVVELTYAFTTAAPEAEPRGGTFNEPIYVALTAEDGATIYYTLNGKKPTQASSVYSAPIYVVDGFQLQAVAYLGAKKSAVTVENYSVGYAQTVRVRDGDGLLDAIAGAGPDYETIINIENDIDAIVSATYTTGKWITIEGRGHVIDGRKQNNTALRFRSDRDRVTLRDVTMKNCATSLQYGGGAVGVYTGDLIVENCAFIGNRAANAAGNNGGGALLAHSASANLKAVNSTFYGNSSSRDGGAIHSRGTGEIYNCTIVGNSAVSLGGGVRHETVSLRTTVYNSVIVGNYAGTGPDVYYATDGGHNIFGVVSELVDPQEETTRTNYTVSMARLAAGAPQDNGGPTPTIALLAGSVAIDDADPDTSPTLDQRGYARDDYPDIGAYEFGGAPSVTVTHQAPDESGVSGSGGCDSGFAGLVPLLAFVLFAAARSAVRKKTKING
jgi:hypothetical protein